MQTSPSNGKAGPGLTGGEVDANCCASEPAGADALTATAGPPSADLTTLGVGHCGVVCDLTAPDHDAERLKIMGVCVGRKVKILKRGDPLILCVWGVRIGVSARLARCILVRPETTAAARAASCPLPG